MRYAGFSLILLTGVAAGCYEGRGIDEGAVDETGDGDGDPGDGDGDPGDGDPGDGDPGDGDPGDGDPGDGDPGDGDGDPGDGDGDPGDGPTPQEIAEVCDRWNLDRANLAEGSWTGSVNGCNAGEMDGPWRARSLAQINLYRWLADLPPVTTSADRDTKAQACALLMQANGALSHSPPMSWSCWTADGSQGAGNSNIAGTAAVLAVDLYMVDTGNASTMGHRRWILSNSLGPTGIGSTDGYSCMWTLGGNGNAGKQWTAWPPPGVFPVEAVNPLWWGGGIDETGWTIQSDELSLGSAQVSVTANGQSLPVMITNLAGGYGSQSAISMIPTGWTTSAGTSYHVEVTGAGAPISYDVHVVACD
jgi:hypothetical protein